jgi:hypothetical protein
MLSLPCCSYSGRRRRRSLEVLLQELRNPSTQDEPEADTMLASSGEGDEDVREFLASHQSLPDWFLRSQVSMVHKKCLGNFRLCSSYVKHFFYVFLHLDVHCLPWWAVRTIKISHALDLSTQYVRECIEEDCKFKTPPFWAVVRTETVASLKG